MMIVLYVCCTVHLHRCLSQQIIANQQSITIRLRNAFFNLYAIQSSPRYHDTPMFSGDSLAAAADPLQPVLGALPSGTLLILDRLDCGGAFLLPLIVRACVQSGHKVSTYCRTPLGCVHMRVCSWWQLAKTAYLFAFEACY